MRILLLSYHLLPDQTSEGLCVAKTARALADSDHHVEVVTAAQTAHPMLEGIPVHRVTPNGDRMPWWTKRLQRLNSLARGRTRGRWLWIRLDAAANIALGCAPDDYAWASAAAAKALALLREPGGEPFDLVYSRLNHFRSHLAAMHVKREMPGMPWCAHFSDPWPGHLYPEGYKLTATRTGLMEKRQEAILDRMLATADSLTFPAERLSRFLLSGPRARHIGKAHVAPHLGYFQVSAPIYSPGEVFTIVFTGLLLPQRYPGTFLRALRRFLDATPSAAGKIEVLFVGRNMPLLDKDVDALDLSHVLRVSPYSDPDDVWPVLCAADVLLLLESPMQEGVFMPSKLADYLSARRPILALSPEQGTVSDYLSEGGGLRVDADSEEGVLDALRTLYNRWQLGCLHDLVPPDSLVSHVLPERVVPLYEAAFRQAVEASK
ncbi:MAG: hypothetical protein WCD37_10640 [Chloroflexia bacterium]